MREKQQVNRSQKILIVDKEGEHLIKQLLNYTSEEETVVEHFGIALKTEHKNIERANRSLEMLTRGLLHDTGSWGILDTSSKDHVSFVKSKIQPKHLDATH